MSKRLSGAWFKLSDEKGIHIGLLMVPEALAHDIERGHIREVYAEPKLPVAYPTNRLADKCNAVLHRFILGPCWFQRNSVQVGGMTVEEIAEEPGFAFIPNAEYLRRPVEPKVEQRRPVPSGPHLDAAKDLAGR